MAMKTNDIIALIIIAVVFAKLGGMFAITNVAGQCIQKVAVASQNVDFRYSALGVSELSQINTQNIAAFLGSGGNLVIRTGDSNYAIWQRDANNCALCGVDTANVQGYGVNANMQTVCPGDYCISNYVIGSNPQPITINKGGLVCLPSKGFCPPQGVMAYVYPCKACEASDVVTVSDLYSRLGEATGSSSSTQYIDSNLFVGREIAGEPDAGQTWLCTRTYVTPITPTTTTTTLPRIIPPSLNFLDKLFADLFTFFSRLFGLR